MHRCSRHLLSSGESALFVLIDLPSPAVWQKYHTNTTSKAVCSSGRFRISLQNLFDGGQRHLESFRPNTPAWHKDVMTSWAGKPRDTKPVRLVPWARNLDRIYEESRAY